MDQTVGVHTARAQARVESLQRVELLLFVLALLTIALEAALIFAPALERLRVELLRGLEAREQQQTAQYRAEAASAFVAQASHELRTPLNGIVGASELLDGTATSPEQASYIQILQSSASTLLTLIDDLLDLSRIEAGKVQYHEQNYDLNALIERVIAMVRAANRTPNLVFRMHRDPALPAMIWGDPRRIQRVLLNLVSNAARYTPQGDIIVHATMVGECVEIAVQDTGVGMTEDEVARIFVPFEQVGDPTKRRHPGTGLGLTITHRLVEDMGGTITVESAADVGSTFTVALPARPGRAKGAPDGASSPNPGSSLRVLLVDDHPNNRSVGKRILRMLGHEVRTADSGPVALDILANDPQFDVVLMDLHMPGMDGYETTRQLRRSSTAARGLPVLACSASAPAHTRAAIHAAGMSGFIAKPITTARLADALSSHTGSKVMAS